MSIAIRPRRSVLYMPGSNARALKRAQTVDVDCLIFDLEDAVAPDAKKMAREQVVEAIHSGNYGYRELIIRINSMETMWGADDLDAAIEACPDAILIPKVNSPADVQFFANRLAVANAPEELRLWAMLETAQSVLNAGDIGLTALDPETRLDCLVMGTNDLSKATRARLRPGRMAMVPWLMTCLAAARAGGIDIIDGVYNNFNDLEGFAAECAQGAELGMDGKTLIHPNQADICNRAFSPKEEEVAWARRVNDAFAQPENYGKGVIQVDGKMVERLHADMGRRVIAIAYAIASRGYIEQD